MRRAKSYAINVTKYPEINTKSAFQMLAYWFLYLIPIYFLLGKVEGGKRTSTLEWWLFGFSLVVMIGLRHHVGGDWYTYLEGLEIEGDIQWGEIFSVRDPGFTLITWISTSIGMSIYGVNIICAVIFTGGLVNLSRTQPYPWLAILVSIPYLVIVVAMGYTRQSAAIGFLMFAFGSLARGRLFSYLGLVLLAGLIHKTAFVFAALVLFRPGGGKLKGVLGVVLLVGFIGFAYLLEQANTFFINYVQNSMESGGSQVRVLMNLLPAMIFFGAWKKWGQLFEDRWLWAVLSLLSILCVPLVAEASTAVDRMALFLIPLQLVVWARFPALVQGRISRTSVFILIAIYYAVVQFTYLNFGTFVAAWLPYDNLFFHII